LIDAARDPDDAKKLEIPRQHRRATNKQMWRAANRGANSTSVLRGKGDYVFAPALLFFVLINLPFRVPPITSSEIQIAIAALAAAVLLFTLIARFRRRAMLKGYEGAAEEVQEISRVLRGRIYREHDDLMLEGGYHRWPVFIRLSHSPDTPGLYIQIPVPTRLTLFFVPKKEKDKHQAGKVVLQTSDEQFDARVITRTDQPVQARMLIAAIPVQQQLPRLCCSSNTIVCIASGLLEVSESLMPETDLGYHVINHVKSMAKIAAETAKIPGADPSLVTPNQAKTNRLMRAFIVTAIVVAIGLFLANWAMQPSLKTRFVPAGILPNDAALIPDIGHWRLAEPQDFDSQGVSWLQASGKQAMGRVSGRFAGEGFPEESAYVLVSDDRRQPAVVRVIVLVNQTVRFDKIYPSIAVMTTIPKSNLGDIAWQGTPPLMPPDGDGVLIVPKYDDPASASITFVHEKNVLTAGTPADFRKIAIQ